MQVRRITLSPSARAGRPHPTGPRLSAYRLAALVASVALLAAACGSADDDSTSAATGSSTPVTASASGPADVLVLSGRTDGVGAYRIARLNPAHGSTEDGRLAFQLTEVKSQTVTVAGAESSADLGPVGPICFLGATTGVLGVGDTGTGGPGLEHFTLAGDAVGSLAVQRNAALDGPDGAGEPTGCAVLEDGRLLTTTAGTRQGADGSLIVWFDVDEGGAGAHCVLDTSLATPQQIVADGADVLVAAAGRSAPGVWRYTDLPTGPTAADGCPDDATSATRAEFITAGVDGLDSPSGLAQTSGGTRWFVSSADRGVINEYDESGTFVRSIIGPVPEIGTEPPPTGTPAALAVAPDGRLYYADSGLVADARVAADRSTGSVRRVDIGEDIGEPEVLEAGLASPGSLALFVPGVTGRPVG